jgi:hypothetical protein
MRVGYTVLICSLAAALVGCRSDESPATDYNAGTESASGSTAGSQRTDEGSATRPASARWCVTGRVSNEAGTPLADVEVTAHCGEGTLRCTGRAVSDEEGQFVLWFGPGMFFLNDETGLQAATIAPHKIGWIERNLHRQGDLRMAKRPPDESELRHWGPAEAVVYPDQPRRVDFVMIPAATIKGRLLDSARRPILNHYVSLDAEELPPSSSVLATMQTDGTGRFRFTEVPAGPVWLSIRSPDNVMHEMRTQTLSCSASDVTEVELICEPGPPSHLTMRPVTSP